mgnify:CR=1 FL=1
MSETCKWYETVGSDRFGVYNHIETECGQSFSFTSKHKVEETDFKYCQYCGKEIEPIKLEEE